MNAEVVSGYAEANGTRLYYEVTQEEWEKQREAQGGGSGPGMQKMPERFERD